MQKLMNPNSDGVGKQEQEDVSEAEVQNVISNTEKLEQIAQLLGFDGENAKNSAGFVQNWLNQISAFGGNSKISQKGDNGDNSLNAVAGSGNDRIAQNGGRGNDEINAFGGAGIDRIIQRGGSGKDVLNAMGGAGNDRISQHGGKGDDKLTALGGEGNDRIVQKGGNGKDVIVGNGGKGDDKIKQKGGRGADHLFADGGEGNDRITQNGGKGDDILEYNVSAGQDIVSLNGGKGKDTAIIHTNGHAVVVQDRKGKVLFASGGQNKNWTGKGTTIKVRSIENLDIRTPENKVNVPDVDPPGPVSAPEPIKDPKNPRGVTDVAQDTNTNVNTGTKATQGTGLKTPSIDNKGPIQVGTTSQDGNTSTPSLNTPSVNTPTVTPPATTTLPPQVATPTVPAPSGSNTGPEICSVYTRSTQVLFSEEAVDVYFNARDAEWDDLTWDYKWSGAVTGSVSNEGPTTWIKTSFNLPALNVIAGQSITIDATVKDPSGQSDTESITIDVIGEEIAVWEVFFDSESVNSDGTGTPERIDPLIFDLNKDGKLDITGANQEGDGKIDGQTVLFDMDPTKQGSTGWKWSSPGHRPGYYEGGPNSRAPRVVGGTAIYDTGKTESTDKHGAGQWTEDRSKGSQADIFDDKGKLVGQWVRSAWGESHGGRIGQYYWEPTGSGEKRERTEWIKGTGDGFLVWDHNNNGIIDDNTEMMSEFDKDGKKQFNNGFEKLAYYFDKDKDGVIKGSELSELKFWVDDGDAITEEGELQSLDSYGITEIKLPTAGGMTSNSTIGKMPG